MNNNSFKALFACVLFVLLFTSFSYAQHKSGINNGGLPNYISEEKFITINGIEQWVTIKGDSTKPAILFLHGGPGSTMSPYSDSLYKDWQKDFVIIQWDQRGAGRTFGVHAPEELTPAYLKANSLTLKQIASDGIALSEYLLKRLGKQKLIIFGTSWGSQLGLTIVSQRPDLYYAYVGHSQVITFDDDKLYSSVLTLAKNNNDTSALNILNTIGKPPYSRARDLGKLFRVVKKYERATSTPPPSSWFVAAPPYNNPKDEQDRELGDDYSFANFAGDKQLDVPSMRANINFMRDNPELKLPVYFIQGAHDLLTPKENSKAYFDKLKAPQKKYYLLPDAAHGFNQSVLDTQYKVFKSIQAL